MPTVAVLRVGGYERGITDESELYLLVNYYSIVKVLTFVAIATTQKRSFIAVNQMRTYFSMTITSHHLENIKLIDRSI